MRIVLSFSAQLTQNLTTRLQTVPPQPTHILTDAQCRRKANLLHICHTGHTKLPATHNARMTPTVQLFSGLLAQLCFFYGFPEHCRCCSIAKQTQPFYATQMPGTKKSGEIHVQNILFVHQLSTEKYRLKFFH